MDEISFGIMLISNINNWGPVNGCLVESDSLSASIFLIPLANRRRLSSSTLVNLMPVLRFNVEIRSLVKGTTFYLSLSRYFNVISLISNLTLGDIVLLIDLVCAKAKAVLRLFYKAF